MQNYSCKVLRCNNPTILGVLKRPSATPFAVRCPWRKFDQYLTAQEVIVATLRTTLLPITDDLLTRQFINPAVPRTGLGRCLRRHGVSNLHDFIAVEDAGEPVAKKTFKNYEPGFSHIDIKYLPQMLDETSWHYLLLAIDRATRWAYLEIYDDQPEASRVDFLSKARAACPLKIIKLLTDNGSQLTDRFTSRKKDAEGKPIPSGKHVFDALCKQLQIEHRLIPPRHPQTNGIVERVNGRISELVNQTRFGSAAEFESTLRYHMKIHKNSAPKRALKHQTQVEALKKMAARKAGIIRETRIQRILTVN